MKDQLFMEIILEYKCLGAFCISPHMGLFSAAPAALTIAPLPTLGSISTFGLVVTVVKTERETERALILHALPWRRKTTTLELCERNMHLVHASLVLSGKLGPRTIAREKARALLLNHKLEKS
jgi:hypothetical protein